MRTLSLSLLLAAAGTASAQCSTAASNSADLHAASWSPQSSRAALSEHPNIVETAASVGTFSTLLAAAQAAGLVDVLTSEGPFTVFAPTDDAFAKLPEGAIADLLKPENKDTLRAILLYHVVPGSFDAAHVTGAQSLTTALGQRLDVSVSRDAAKIDAATITATDVRASNGIIHVIDSVVMPETRSIPEVADAAGSFSTLLAAVRAAGLADTLMGEGPYTVFAPTDEAFAALGSTVNDLLKPENLDRLKTILLYHVVPGRVYADQVVALRQVNTAASKPARITASADSVMINQANIIAADVEASTGVIHVIDAVILPE